MIDVEFGTQPLIDTQLGSYLMVEYVLYGISKESGWQDWLPPILSAIAAVMSAIAAVVSVWLARRAINFSSKQTELLETHNKLSVRPHLDGHTFFDTEKKVYKFIMTNNGAGPAILKGSEIYFKDELVNAPDPLVYTIEMIFDHGPNPGPGKHHYGHESVGIDQYIIAGKSVDVFTAYDINGETCEELGLRVEKDVRMVLTYESIYGESFTFDSRK